MGYQNFAYYYDALNQAADYERLCKELVRRLKQYGVPKGLVADLGCGTGEVSLRLAKAGYDLIAVDASADMLSVFREKLAETGQGGILLLNQPLEELDLYGTIRAAVSTFDTLNHLAPAPLCESLRRISLFLEPGGLFFFDVNTPYKHEAVLAENSFDVETEEGLACFWKNQKQANATQINLKVSRQGRTLAEEQFLEYIYPLGFWEENLPQNGFRILEILDGESFSSVFPQSQRYFILAQKTK